MWVGLLRAPYWVATASNVPATVVGFALDCWRVYKTGIKLSQHILLHLLCKKVTLYPLARPVRATTALYPIGRLVRTTYYYTISYRETC